MSFGINRVLLLGHLGSHPREGSLKGLVTASALVAVRELGGKDGLTVFLSYISVEAYGHKAKTLLSARRSDGVCIEGSFRSRMIKREGQPNRWYNWVQVNSIYLVDHTSVRKSRKWIAPDADSMNEISEKEFYKDLLEGD